MADLQLKPHKTPRSSDIAPQMVSLNMSPTLKIPPTPKISLKISPTQYFLTSRLSPATHDVTQTQPPTSPFSTSHVQSLLSMPPRSPPHSVAPLLGDFSTIWESVTSAVPSNCYQDNPGHGTQNSGQNHSKQKTGNNLITSNDRDSNGTHIKANNVIRKDDSMENNVSPNHSPSDFLISLNPASLNLTSANSASPIIEFQQIKQDCGPISKLQTNFIRDSIKTVAVQSQELSDLLSHPMLHPLSVEPTSFSDSEALFSADTLPQRHPCASEALFSADTPPQRHPCASEALFSADPPPQRHPCASEALFSADPLPQRHPCASEALFSADPPPQRHPCASEALFSADPPPQRHPCASEALFSADPPPQRHPCAAYSDIEQQDCSGSLRQLEELELEQESLNNSLLALTSHFAQVQFRLKQIVDSDRSEKDMMLKDLERFAFDGCQDLPSVENVHESICSTFERRLAEQKAKHEELIFQLKYQLKDLEHYAKQSSEVKTNEQIRRHKLVLEQIRNYLKIDISDLYSLPSDELQEKVEAAVQDILAPIRSKEQMLHQLTTQVQDLERFIEFLHGTGKTPNAVAHEIRRCTCDCPLHGETNEQSRVTEPRGKVLRREGIELLSKTLLMFQVIVINSLRMVGCQWQSPDKAPTFMCHVRRLEESVDNFIRVHNSSQPDRVQDLLLDMVRKKLAVHLKILLAHGLRPQKKDSMALVSCASKNRHHVKGVHPWTLLTEFYTQQHGKTFTEQPQYQLSQSFGLRIQRQSINSKQSLLSCIHKVRETHEPYKRSNNAKFKALIIYGVNDGVLGQWLRVLASCDTLHQQVYEPWSYMSKHGFSHAIKILDRLSQVKLDLPTDVALKIFYVPEDTETPVY